MSLYLSRGVVVSYDLSLGFTLRTWDNLDLLEFIERRMPSVLWLECARRANVRDISGSDLERFIQIGVKKQAASLCIDWPRLSCLCPSVLSDGIEVPRLPKILQLIQSLGFSKRWTIRECRWVRRNLNLCCCYIGSECYRRTSLSMHACTDLVWT